jgi:hypothetical protein
MIAFPRYGAVPYIREGTEKFLAAFGSPLPPTIIGGKRWQGIGQDPPKRAIAQAIFETDPQAPADGWNWRY